MSLTALIRIIFRISLRILNRIGKNVGRESGVLIGSINEKTRGQKSRATVPLMHGFSRPGSDVYASNFFNPKQDGVPALQIKNGLTFI